VIYAIYGKDEKLKPLLDEPGGIHESLAVTPDDRLWGQAEPDSDVKDGVTRLDDIGDDLCAQPLRDSRVKEGQTSDCVGVRGMGPIGGQGQGGWRCGLRIGRRIYLEGRSTVDVERTSDSGPRCWNSYAAEGNGNQSERDDAEMGSGARQERALGTPIHTNAPYYNHTPGHEAQE
jgi:hypothetical protein